MGELHLEVLTDRMIREFGVNARVSKLQVAYRETISTAAEARGTHIHKTDEEGIYGDVLLTVEPLERGDGFQFEDETDETQLPRQYIAFIEKALQGAMGTGAPHRLPNARYKGDRSRAALIIQPIPHKSLMRRQPPLAFENAVRKAEPLLLEPIMRIHITVPDEHVGKVIGDLNARRAQINESTTQDAAVNVINAFIPLSETFQYTTQLRSMTQGRGAFTLEFSHYDVIPQSLAPGVNPLISA